MLALLSNDCNVVVSLGFGKNGILIAQANNFADDGADGNDEVVLMVGEDGGSTAVRVPRQVMHVRQVCLRMHAVSGDTSRLRVPSGA